MLEPREESHAKIQAESLMKNTTKVDAVLATSDTGKYKLLTLSAYDERAVQRSISSHEAWMREHPTELLSNVAFTLNAKRSAFPWKTFSVASSDTLNDLEWSPPARIKQQTRLCFIFTGQGAQYVGMGRGLFKYEVFRQSMLDADQYFKGLGSDWSLLCG